MNLRFSIIIPTYNRKKQILETLKRLSKQKYDTNLFEVVVIDDGSSDGTKEEISLFKKNSKIDINLISQKNKGPAHARNSGIKVSKYEYIIFLDSDCYPITEDWLSNISDKVKDIHSSGYDDFLLAGRIFMPKDTISQKFILCLNGYGTPDLGKIGFEKKDDFISFPTTNLIIPKKTFKNIGGFDENIIYGSGEDTDLCYRLWKSGNVVFVYEPSIAIFHLHRTGIFDMVRMAFKRSVNSHTLLEKYGILSKRCFRRRLIKVCLMYIWMTLLIVSSFIDMKITIGLIFGSYIFLFLVFLLKSKNVLYGLVFPFYYVLLSIFEVLGSTIAIISSI